MHRIGDSLQVVVGQQHAGGGFHMRRKYHGGLFLRDRRRDFGDGGGRPGGFTAFGDAPGLEHGVALGNAAHVEDLGPAEAEPAVADDHDVLVLCELAGYRFHAKGAAARYQGHRVGAIDLLEHARDVGHHATKAFGHVVERAVGVDDREFEQAVGVDLGQQAGHGESPCCSNWGVSLPEMLSC